MASIETTEKKIYVWPIDDAETDRLSALLKMDFKTFNMKQHYLHSPQYVCHTCGKLTGLDDSVGTALALGAHDVQFVIDYIKNPTPRVFHAHELHCCVDGTTYLERYSMERPEGQALRAHFEALKASGGTPAPLSADATEGDSARLEYVPTWFSDQHVASGKGATAKVEYYPKWFDGNTAMVSYYPKWFSPDDPTALAASEKHTGKVEPEAAVDATAQFKYYPKWFAGPDNATAAPTASGETAKFEYVPKWFAGPERADDASGDEAAKVQYYPKWFAGPEDGNIDTAKLEYYPKWFTGPEAAAALNATGDHATFEYYPKWFAAEAAALPAEGDAGEASDSSDKAANILYYPKWFVSK
ncbi:hypothetical protein BU16DRAFT_525540 [Lophium mytilinum]|uniref:Uncharacterized protein n=1 Tax=Lophium mytilinum TaxID=390894 RepID=A0A6A6R0C1_9PEZI|nr:hypothetical protein BU16DRAFT_525540 [Lophium mytilinum]